MIGLISARKARRVSEGHDLGLLLTTKLRTWDGMRDVNRCIRDAAKKGETHCNTYGRIPGQVIELLKKQGYEVQEKYDMFSGTYDRISWGGDGDREGDEDREPDGDI